MEGALDWIDLAQDMDRRRAVANSIVKLRIPNMRGIS